MGTPPSFHRASALSDFSPRLPRPIPRLLAGCLVALGATCGVLRAQPQAAPPPANQPRPTFTARPNRPPLLRPDEYLPSSRLRGGMKGYGLSVFRGNTIERFDVTILGVIKKANNGRDLILVKLGGPKMQRVTDVIAGMSGSPVYVNGKIVGAVAYGAQFTREPIGYLTPIEDMVDAWDTNLPQSAEAPDVPAGLKPLMAKVTVSGVSGPRLRRIQTELAKFGIEARQGGGRGAGGLAGSPLTPGGAVAMSLATGDMDMTAVGTLTYRRGKQVVAFGHPFLGIGPIDAPMFSAYIHDIQPSFSESEKIGSPVKMVGAFSQDRPFSVGGKIGAAPRLIPITVRVNDRSMGKQRVFRARLMRHPQLTPALAALAAGTAIAEVHGQPGDAMATVTTEVIADGVGRLRHTTRVFDDSAMDEAAISDLRQVLGLMTGNPFYPVGVRGVNLTVNIEAGRRTAQVERIFLKQGRFAPGETVEVGVVLKPYKKPSFVRTLSIKIPANAPSGSLLLTVQGGSASGLSGLVSLLSGARAPEYANAATVEQLLHKWEERERGDQLIARLTLPTGAVSVRGEKLDGLPLNIENAMRAGMSRTSGTRVERDEVKVAQVIPYIVSGAQVLAVQVVRPDTPSQPAPVTLPPSGSALPSGGGGASFTPPPGAAFDPDITSDNAPLPRLSLPDQPPAPIRVSAPAPGGAAPAGAARPAAPPAAPSATAPTASAPSVGRQPGVWRQATQADFRGGTLRGVAVSERGEITVAPRLAKVTESDEPFFWSVIGDGKGGVYAGSGDRGLVYHVGADGKRTVAAQTGEISVHALCRAADGTLYAGTSPGGQVYRIGADGKATKFFQASGKHVVALALSPDGAGLYVGTGGALTGALPAKARVYAVPLADPARSRVIYEGDDTSVSALAVSSSGDVYAGTSPGGLIVRVAPGGASAATVVYDAPEASVSGLVAQEDGTVYAAMSPRPIVYRLAPGAAPRVVYERAASGAPTPGAPLPGLSALAQGADGKLYAASGALVAAITPGQNGRADTYQTFEAPSDIQILALAPDPGGAVWAATGSVGGVYALRSDAAAPAATGEYVSPVFDARAVSQWGTLRWAGDGAGIRLETRSGNTSEPDAGWSNWLPQTASRPVASPPARYLQYRATLTGSATLRGVEAFYLPPNQAPQLNLVAPRGGEVWRGTQTVRWSANDADRDTLTFDVSVSGDGGKTWQPVSAARPAPAPTPARGTSVAEKVLGNRNKGLTATADLTTAPRPVATDVEAELAKHPELSADMKAKILADAQAAAALAPPAAATNTPSTRDTSAPLDTARLADGTYLVRVIASDRLANPTGALSTERVSGTFRVLNRAPSLTLPAALAAYTPGADRTVRLEGLAAHPTPGALIRGVQFRVDGGEWTAALASDGIFDSAREPFTLTTSALTPGTHTLEVQAQDEAGNEATQKRTLIVR